MGEVNSAASVEFRKILGAALASNINEKTAPIHTTRQPHSSRKNAPNPN